MEFEFKTKPFPHQLEDFHRFKDLDNGGLYWDTGLGKAKTCIDLIRYKYQKHGEGPVLILCPDIVVPTWVEQIEEHSYMSDLVQVLDGTKEQRLRDLNKPDKLIFITNYDTLRTPKHYVEDGHRGVQKDPLTVALLARHWSVVVADEAHRIKNHRSQRGMVLAELGLRADCRLAATGTPYLRNYLDFFNQFKFLDRGESFGRVFAEYKYRYFVDLNASWQSRPGYFPFWSNDPADLDKTSMSEDKKAVIREIMLGKFNELKAKIAAGSSRRTKADTFGIVDPLLNKVYAKMTKEMERAYQDVLKDNVHWIESHPEEAVVAKNVLTRNLRLMQISSGYMVNEDGTVRWFKDNPKLDALEELLDTMDKEKVIVSAAFHFDIDAIKDRFKAYNPAEIHGRTKDNDAGKEKFKNDKTCRLLIAHPHSLIGINDLTCASDIIFYSNNNAYEDRHQSIGRVHARGTSKIPATVYDILCSDMDRLILDALHHKKSMSDMILNYYKNKT